MTKTKKEKIIKPQECVMSRRQVSSKGKNFKPRHIVKLFQKNLPNFFPKQTNKKVDRQANKPHV